MMESGLLQRVTRGASVVCGEVTYQQRPGEEEGVVGAGHGGFCGPSLSPPFTCT